MTGSQSQKYSAPSSLSKEPSPPTPGSSHWPSLNPLTAYYTPSHVQPAESPPRMDVDAVPSSSSGTLSAASPDKYYDGRASSVSLDDPDVRMAAEALGDLRAGTLSGLMQDPPSPPPPLLPPLPPLPPTSFLLELNMLSPHDD